MKTTTAAFDAVWAGRTKTRVWKVELLRRYWNGAAYALEATPLTLREGDIVDISAITRRIDERGALRISNVTLKLKNHDQEWLPTNTATGRWAPDATAADGYDPINSEIRIYAGYRLDDDTEEMLVMFTGVIDDEPHFDSQSGTASFTAIALAEAKMRNANAQKVCVTITNGTTTPPQGDGSNLIFDTGLKSLWDVKNAREAGVAVVQGDAADFTPEDLNDAEVTARLEFITGQAPANLATILYDGKQWHRDISASAAIGRLCDQAGIAAADRIIEEPIYPVVDQSAVIEAAADWAAGSGTQFDAIGLAGTLRRRWWLIDSFADNEYAANPAWVISNNEGSPGGTGANTVSAATGKLVLTSTWNIADFDVQTVIAGASAYGSWDFKFRSQSVSNSVHRSHAVFIRRSADGIRSAGYSLSYDWDAMTIKLMRNDGSGPAVAITSSLGTPDAVEHTWRITRTEAGLFTVYLDGNLTAVGSGTDATYDTNGYFSVNQTKTQGGDLITTIDDVYFSRGVFDPSYAVSDADMDWVSDEIDLLAAPEQFLPLQIAEALNGGSRTIKTQTAAVSGGPYDAEVAVDASLTPQSALKRYFKLVLEAARAAGSYTAPEFTRVVVNWRDDALFIKSLDLTGFKNCLEAAAEIAAFTGMDHGSTDDGKYYFRNPVAAGAADMTLNQKNAVVNITNLSLGYRQVKTKIQVRYGKSGDRGYYFTEYGAVEAGDASPTSEERFGERVREIVLDRFLFSNNANVAEALAAKAYAADHLPRRRGKAPCRFIPQLDNRDRVALSFHVSPLIEEQIMGDPLQTAPAIGGAPNTLLRDVSVCVKGKTDSVIQGTTNLDWEEILS